jgi:signal transduction histidine kinase
MVMKRVRKAALLIQILLVPLFASAPKDLTNKKVLALYWYGKDFPLNVEFDQGIEKVLQSGRIEYHAEYFEPNFFPGEAQAESLRDYLKRKYSLRGIDVVVAMSWASADFLIKYRDELFPNVPMVFHAASRAQFLEKSAAMNAAGVVPDNNQGRSLDLALRFHPGTEHVFVINGTPEKDKTVETFLKQQFKQFETQVKFTYLTDLPLDDLLAQVKSIPERSIIFYSRQDYDEPALKLSLTDVLSLIASTAKVPIYVSGAYAGYGSVGGYVVNAYQCGMEAGQLAVRILNGEQPKDLPVVEVPSIPTFDWRQLQNWNIREDGLPANSIVRFKELSLWESHRWQIIGAISLCMIETILIAGLMVQRAQRNRMQEGLKQSETALRESNFRIQDLAGRLIEARDQERQHIAREIHDDLTQRVAAIGIGLSTLRRKFPEADVVARDRISLLREQVTGLNEWIRRLSHELHPSILEHTGLVAALRDYCQEFTNEQEIVVSLDIQDGLEPIETNLSLCLYRVVQESLHNIAKHAGTKSAEIRLTRVDDALNLTVTDHGAGFDPKIAGRGLGLMSMEERVKVLHGTFQVKTGFEAGTEITVRIPLRSSYEQKASTAGR